MIPNPAWVDKVLHKHWGAIEKAVGSRFMPLPAPTVGKKDRFLEYGCGHYGCVMPSRTDGFVFKVSSDPTEAVFIAAASQLKGGWPDGIVQYKHVFQIPGESHARRDVFVIVREEARDVGGLLKFRPVSGKEREVARFVKRLVKFKEWAAKARDLIRDAAQPGVLIQSVKAEAEWAEDYVSWDLASTEEVGKSYVVTRSNSKARKAAYAIRSAWIVSEEMSNEDVGYEVGKALSYYIENGMLLADVHGNNVGIAEREDYSNGLWVITDPGHMVPIVTKWMDVAVPQL